MSGCPDCGGAYVEAQRCYDCGDYYPADDLIESICNECLCANVTYDKALQFLLDTEDYFDLFMFEKWYESSVQDVVGNRLRNLMVTQYKREKAEEILLGKRDFLNAIKQFILDDDGDCGKETYAKWLRR